MDLEQIKEFLKKYIVYILIGLILIFVILLIIPSKTNNSSKVQKLYFSLYGDEKITLEKGETYKEPGYNAYDTVQGNLNNKVIITGQVDSNTVGVYEIIYMVTNEKGETKTLKRIVTVVDKKNEEIIINATISPSEITNKDVTINFSVTSGSYKFILDPDGNINYSNNVKYIAKENGEYDFSVKNQDGTIVEKTIKISNIDKIKPTGTCQANIKNTKTNITVQASDNFEIKKYEFILDNNKYESKLNSYEISKEIKSANVIIYDKASNSTNITCKIIDNRSSSPSPTPTIPTTPISGSYYNADLKAHGLKYIIYYPGNLNLQVKNPLVVYLHGTGECNNDISTLENVTFVKNMKSKYYTDAVYLAPQCVCSGYWDYCLDNLKSLIDKVVVDYNIDTKRISITGASAGGIGVYSIISKYPRFFSAAVVVAGRNKDGIISNLIYTPIRHYHGTLDTAVSYTNAKENVEAIKRAGGNIEFISLQGRGHDISVTNDVYNHTNAISWMISQKR